MVSYVPQADLVDDPIPPVGREWLVTNGPGAYASETVAGALNCRYHGLLVAALDLPLGRTGLVVTLLQDRIGHQ